MQHNKAANHSRRRRLPLSGSEPTFETMPWGTAQGVRGSNCYDYSLNDFRKFRKVKTTPGDKAKRQPRPDATFDKCVDVVPGILADNPGDVYREAAEKPCRAGFYKIQSYVGGGARGQAQDVGDFHFYRQNKDVEYVTEEGETPASIAKFLELPIEVVLKAAKTASKAKELPAGMRLMLKDANVWSHKAGWATGALLKDSCGKAITDPRKACRSHAVDYDTYCGSFCVKAGSRSSAANAAGRTNRPT